MHAAPCAGPQAVGGSPLKIAEKRAAIDEQSFRAHVDLAPAHFRAGRFAEAITELERKAAPEYMSAEPNRLVANFIGSMCLAKVNRTDQARTIWEQTESAMGNYLPTVGDDEIDWLLANQLRTEARKVFSTK